MIAPATWMAAEEDEGFAMATIRPLLVELTTDERLALSRFASERGLSLDEAAALSLREWLMLIGYLGHELDEGTETVGSA
jgi:hypothetical protein